MPNPIVLVHGYSSSGKAFARWEEILHGAGFDRTKVLHTCNYESLTNEVTIKDIAEGFDRALRIRAGLDSDEDFDCIVHSTGMLVIRSWLTTYPKRRARLKRLIGLAPATNGSPMAHKGRSMLGAIFKGRKTLGPDFLEAGDQVLDGLELGSKFTWDLAHLDMFGAEAFYGPNKSTPYVFIFCGNSGYGGFADFAYDKGSDGTVRMAGCALDSRKIVLDLTREPRNKKRFERIDPEGVDSPAYIVPGLNHGTILSDPPQEMIDLVVEALGVSSKAQWEQWNTGARIKYFANPAVEPWQQFVVRCVDERGDPVTDYNVQLLYEDNEGLFRGIREFDAKVHVYDADKSLRCFHVNLNELEERNPKSLQLRLMASTGSALVIYHGHRDLEGDAATREEKKWTGIIDVGSRLTDPQFKFFYPHTTTFVELRLNREPAPLDLTKPNKVCWFP